jgi:hypothetical protein
MGNGMSYFSQFGAGNIKSIQRGVTGSVLAGAVESITITSVDTSKSILTNLGVRVTNTGSPEWGSQGYFTLANSTTIVFTMGSVGQPNAGSWQLVEYY